jgi:hypothetical protein
MYRHAEWWKGFRNYAVEMGSSEFNKYWFSHSEVKRGTQRDTHRNKLAFISSK